MIHGVSDCVCVCVCVFFSDRHLEMTEPTQLTHTDSTSGRQATANTELHRHVSGLVLQAGAMRITLRIQSPVLT